MSVDQEGRLWHCHACGAGGDVFHLAERYGIGSTFIEQAEELAAMFSIPLQREGSAELSPEEKAARKALAEKRDLKALMKKVLDQTLAWGSTSVDRHATYLGWDDEDGAQEIMSRAKVSYWPGSGMQETPTAFGRDLVALGLWSHANRPLLKGRTTIPIFDVSGVPISMAGRLAPGALGPKYVNGATTSIFDKKAEVYCLPGARRGAEILYVVEGYTDVMALEMGNFPAVGLMGTASGPEKPKRILSLNPRKVCVWLDPDEAGRKAATTLAVSLLGVNPDTILLLAKTDEAATAAGMDPADVIRSGGVWCAYPYLEEMAERAKRDSKQSSELAARISEDLLPVADASFHGETDLGELVRQGVIEADILSRARALSGPRPEVALSSETPPQDAESERQEAAPERDLMLLAAAIQGVVETPPAWAAASPQVRFALEALRDGSSAPERYSEELARALLLTVPDDVDNLVRACVKHATLARTLDAVEKLVKESDISPEDTERALATIRKEAEGLS